MSSEIRFTQSPTAASMGPNFNQIEEQEQDADEQKKATDAIRLALLAQQFEELKTGYYADNVIIKQKIKRLDEKHLELCKDLKRIDETSSRTYENLKIINEINSQVAEGCLRLEKKREETSIAISKGIFEMKSKEANLDKLQKITNDLLLGSKDQDHPEEVKEEKNNAKVSGDEIEVFDLPIQNPDRDYLKISSVDMQVLLGIPEVNNKSQVQAMVVKNLEDDSIEEVSFKDKSPKKPEEIIEQLPTKNVIDFIPNSIEEKKEELSDLPKNAQQQNQIIEEPSILSVFPELFSSETHIEENGNPQSNISNDLIDATLLNSASSITQAALPHSVRQTTISNKEIKLSTPIPSVPTPIISQTQKLAIPTNNEKTISTDPLKIKNQKIISQKVISKNIFQRTCLLFLNLMVNIFYRWPSILLQKFRKTKI